MTISTETNRRINLSKYYSKSQGAQEKNVNKYFSITSYKNTRRNFSGYFKLSKHKKTFSISPTH